MSRCTAWLLPLTLVLALPQTSWAQRGRYSNVPAHTADGVVFNPAMTPEYRQAGGNWDVYNQLMMQKMQQQQMQQAMAYQKQWDAYLKANPDVKKQLEAQQKQQMLAQQKQQRELLGLNYHKKAKKPTTATSKDAISTDKADEPTTSSTASTAKTPVAGAPAPTSTTSATATKTSTTAATKKSGKK